MKSMWQLFHPASFLQATFICILSGHPNVGGFYSLIFNSLLPFFFFQDPQATCDVLFGRACLQSWKNIFNFRRINCLAENYPAGKAL